MELAMNLEKESMQQKGGKERSYMMPCFANADAA
jgi:hypothetical protein